MFLYRVLSTLALLLYAPYGLLRSWLGHRRLGDLAGRLGRRPYPNLSGGVWVHAVSVGEVGVARNLIAALQRKAPGTRIGLSVTTAAGREIAEPLSIFEDIVASNGIYAALRSQLPFAFGPGTPSSAGELEYYARVTASFRFQ